MFYQNDKNVLSTFCYMFTRSMKVARQNLADKIINQLFWSCLNIIVFAYVMPRVGFQDSFGSFIAITMLPSAALFISINSMYGLLFEVTSEGSNLKYELTLPIPQWLVFAKYGLENAVQSFFVTLIVAPVGFALIWNQMHFSFLWFFCDIYCKHGKKHSTRT